MTDLTEQWKKGQLKSFRWYYVKFKTGEIDICWFTEWSNDELGTGGQYFDGIEEENVLEVLAPVPSYVEWQQLKEYERIVTSYNMKPIDYDIACETVNKLLDKIERLKGQLRIAIEQLKDTYVICFRNKDTLLHTSEHNVIGGIERDCAIALQQIEELEK